MLIKLVNRLLERALRYRSFCIALFTRHRLAPRRAEQWTPSFCGSDYVLLITLCEDILHFPVVSENECSYVLNANLTLLSVTIVSSC